MVFVDTIVVQGGDTDVSFVFCGWLMRRVHLACGDEASGRASVAHSAADGQQ